MGLAEKAGKYDTDGIDIYFLNADDTRTELEGRNMTVSLHFVFPTNSPVLTLVTFVET